MSTAALATDFTNKDNFMYDCDTVKMGEFPSEKESCKESDEQKVEDNTGTTEGGGGGVIGALSEFSENTNFHGFRYIFAAYTIFGRIAWLLIFLIAVGGLAYQTMDRVKLYNLRPVNVNIDVKRAPFLPFPALVLCNTNQYRMTKAEEMGVYYGIRDYFTSRLNGTAKIDPKLDQMDYRNLTLELAHQKNDFIYDCQWGSEKCGVQNFTSFVTDFGLCFAFNNNPDSTRKLNIFTKGETSGLKVVVNLEQYEYMAGPNAAAGIKMLLYNESDFPRVRDLGLAIPPASNTLIGFKVSSVKNLKPSYGRCGEIKLKNYKKYSESSCEVECMAKKVVEACGCRSLFMAWDEKDPNPPPYCSLSQIDKCVKKEREAIDHRQCECPLPCDESFFLTTVSYSAISDFEAFNMAAYIAQHRPDIVKRFRAGKVSWARLDDETAAKDKKHIKDIFTEAVKMNDSIADQNGNSKDQSSEFMTMLTAVEKDVKTLSAAIEAEVAKAKRLVEAEVNTYKDSMDYEATSMIMFDIENLLGREIQMLFTIFSNCIALATPQNGGKVRTDCKPKVEERMTAIKTGYMGKIDVLVDILKTVEGLYTLVVQDKFDGKWNGANVSLPEPLMREYGNETLKLLKEFKVTIETLRDKNKLIDTCAVTLGTFIPLAPHALPYSSIVTKAGQCQTLAGDVQKYITEKITANYKTYINLLKTPQNKLGEETVNLNRLMSNLAIASGNMYGRIGKFRQIQANPAEEMPSMVKLINNASQLHDLEPNWRRLSKEQVAIEFAGNAAYLAVEKAVLEKKDFLGNLDLLMNYMRDVQTMEYKLLEVITESQKSRKRDSNSTALLKAMIARMPSYIRKVKELKDKVDVIEFTLEYRHLVESLVSFRKSLEVNQQFYKDNFLTVSLYFQVLQHQDVTQQEGYTWFSLLCDVGGTAGLFIGASFLSIIEMFYFFGAKSIMSCIAYHKNRKKVKPEPLKF